jgi:hypothetical protein
MKMTTRTRALDKVFKRRHRFQIPSWQRGKVWGKSKQQLLVDTILRGWKLPKFSLIKSSDTDSEFEVADGQQRLNAIWDFMSNNLELSPESKKIFGGPFYKDLPDALSDSFDDFEIEFDEIEEESEVEIKAYFQRLQEGMSLIASEKLNAVDSKLRDFTKALTGHKFFTETVAFKDTRYAYFEVASKAAAVEVEGVGTGLRVDDLKRIFETQSSFSPASEVAKRLTKALDFLHKALPKSATITRNRSTTQSLINLACRLVEHGDPAQKSTQFGQFSAFFSQQLAEQVELGQDATDPDYLGYQRTVNANVKTGPKTRQTILLRKLFLFDPSFADLFEASTVASSDVDGQTKGVAAEIRTILLDVNEMYAAKNGTDLFNISNKTTKALAVIGETAKTYDKFSMLISNLYFIFRESLGKKLTPLPQSFVDVNDLRISLQHDLDQEGPSQAAKKKVKHGTTFEKYSGIGSPSVAGPQRLSIAQLKLLSALRDDLFAIANALT